MPSSLTEISDAYSKAKSYVYLGGKSPLNHCAAEQTQRVREEYESAVQAHLFQQFLSPPDKTSQPNLTQNPILLLCN